MDSRSLCDFLINFINNIVKELQIQKRRIQSNIMIERIINMRACISKMQKLQIQNNTMTEKYINMRAGINLGFVNY